MNSERHSHEHGEDAGVRTLGAVAAINLAGFVIELLGGLAFGSVALVGDAFHMLFDSLAYVMALIAAYIGTKSEPGEYWSYGLSRVEPFAAFLNGVLLVPMVVFLLWESYQRYLSPVDIDPWMTMLLGTGGLVINLVSVYVVQGGEMSLNERGAFYHLLGDAGASVAVILSMLFVEFGGYYIADPITAALIAVIIIWSAVKLLRESGAIFFQRSPISVDALEARIDALNDVTAVSDVHVWSLSSRLDVATVHVTSDAETISERDELKRSITELLHDEFGIDHVTIDVRGEESPTHPTEHGD
ncbi:cation diffusion facilitator family transporter (plasmid) [Halobacterium sp. NMX12-1]|jgi:cobalt-zinc-cadmium efflux system protein|uniref:Cation diffusion facilitator family transporter n=1 Tax=Halobacterium sp. NMX12-1 TaxID=3166650 RepID=A0AAU8CH72_9EURY